MQALRVAVHGAAPRLSAALAGYGLEIVDASRAEVVVAVDHDVELGGSPVLLLGPVGPGPLADAAGLLPGRLLPVHEVRVRAGRDAGQVAARWPAPFVPLRGAFRLVEKLADDVEQLLTANVARTDHPLATWRPATGVGVLGLSADDHAEPARLALLVRVLRHLAGRRDGPPVPVGMLGYGAIGHEHALALAAVDGLELAAVCDPEPTRIAAAHAYAPDLTGHADGSALLDDDAVELVIVSTPPSTHAEWVLRALEAGKHVVVEKPFCLTVAQADRQIAAAAEAGLLLAVYQNRRWDRDFLALRAAVRTGRIGELFHLESFVGGYEHPCNFWHSDVEVSGGHLYDWGSHYLDQILELLPQPVTWVSATAHKRVWHDVTNADHTRVLLHFDDGAEAEFTASDLAAARKPKWYVLGTTGAVVGDWQQERVVRRSPIGLAEEDRFAVADSPAAMSLMTPDGSRTHLALPAAPAQPFHRELADALLAGAPMSVTPAASRRTIAVMQAATASAADGGRPVVPRA